MSRFGLVTVLYNDTAVLDDFFESLSAQTFQDWFLIVVDNSPDDGPINKARALVAQHALENAVFFIRNDENLGVAAGNNQGIVAARQRGCEYVILLNNDIVIADDKLLHLIGTVINDKIGRAHV